MLFNKTRQYNIQPFLKFIFFNINRGVNLYGFCDLHGLTGVRCNLYRYLWFLQIQTYNHSTLYIRTVLSLQWHQLCFVSTKVNDLSHNKLCFVHLLFMGVLQRDPIPKLCFGMVLTICKDFFCRLYRFFVMILQIWVVPGWHLWR